MAKAPKKSEAAIEIQEINMGRIHVNLLGTTALIMHRFASKAWHELLLPSPKKNAAEKAESLKHDPVGEFREALYMNRSQSEPALFHYPSNAFGKALAAAAIDIPGATKSQMSRLTSITSTQINFYGLPELFMAMVRSSDMARTPDVRTRPIFPEWACTIEIQFVSSLIKEKQVVNLLAAAGIIVGLGDWRPQKGGPFGQFKLVEDSDEDFQRIVQAQGRAAQLEAMANPRVHDADSEELLAWFKAEVDRREKIVPSDDFSTDDVPSAAVIARGKANGKTNGKHRTS